MLASAVSRFAGALRGLESHRLLRSRHTIRLRHEAGIGTKEAKEVVVVNAHDRYSAYNTMAGVRSPMAQHGRIPRDPRTRNTAPW